MAPYGTGSSGAKKDKLTMNIATPPQNLLRDHQTSRDLVRRDFGIEEPRSPYPSQSSHVDNNTDILNLLKIVWKRKFLIAAFAILGLILSTLFIANSAPLYKATNKVEIQEREVQVVEGSGLEPVAVADAQFMATQYALLKSRALAERVVLNLNLDNNPEFVDLESPRDDRTRQSIKKLKENLSISPEGESRIVNITYVHTSPEVARDVANSLAETFIESTLERKYRLTAYARNFLEERLEKAKVSLEDYERQLVDYADKNDILDLTSAGQDTSLANDTLVLLNSALSEAQADRIAAEQIYQAAPTGENTLQQLESEDLKRLRAAKSALVAEYQFKLGTFKPKYPDMISLQARIDSIEAEIGYETETLKSANEANYKANYLAAVGKEDALIGEIERTKVELRDLKKRRVDYTILRREADTVRTQYEALLNRMKEVSFTAGAVSSQISIVDEAITAKQPFAPNIPRVYIIGLLLGSAFGIGFALLLNLLDDTIKTPEDVKNKLGLSALGVIPKIAKTKSNNLIVEELTDYKSPVLEAYFSARTALEYSSDKGVPKSLLITSTQPNEGKTSSAVALAIAFARIGQRVLIIDADMRKPSFLSDPEKSVGLSGLLTSDLKLEDNLIESPTHDLHLLPSGVIPPNPAQLLSSPKIKKIIEEAEDLFDLVVVDAPPLLNFTDSPVLAASCKGTILVVKSSSIRTVAVQNSVNRLIGHRANLKGVLLTLFDSKKMGYNNDYYYYAYGVAGSKYNKSSKKSVSTQQNTKIKLFVEKNDA